MKKWVLFFCMLTIVLLLLSGCWNRRELNELAIAMAYGFDKEGDQYLVTTQVVVPSEVASKTTGGNLIPVVVYQAKGATLFEAIRKMTLLSPRKIYASHLRMLVIGEELAKEGISEALDFISRDHENRTDFFVTVARNQKAEDILKVTTILEKIPANQMYQALQTSADAWAPSAHITLDQLIADLISKGKEAVLTGIEKEGPLKVGESKDNVQKIDPPTRLTYTTLAVFKGDRLVGWLTENESKAYNYIHNDVKSTVGHLPCTNGGKVTVEVIRSKSKLKGKVINGIPQIEIDVRTEDSVGEANCEIDLTKTETIEHLEKTAEKGLKDMITKTVAEAQKYKVDIFGFGEEINRSNPDYWKKVKDHWDQEFEKLEVKVNVDVNILRVGTTKYPIMKLIKE
ncbi:Ger(x)C family spore germination protein [Ammoniphilus resinae]|uniref:Spore germination protein KC n=1 Tax=Ammoniphilus resinae TaxID=861532 RepID=A0ABS4GP97_9BACL|nr:Ger(x)C family spore germination protein [Ammoniphilus resinae]MBP1932102.1 spore germination protein KC [Ammoniphilus resinae]